MSLQHQNGLAEARRDWLNFKLMSSDEIETSHGTRVEDEEEWEMWKEAMQVSPFSLHRSEGTTRWQPVIADNDRDVKIATGVV